MLRWRPGGDRGAPRARAPLVCRYHRGPGESEGRAGVCVRPRAMSLVTSFGSCGPTTYEPRLREAVAAAGNSILRPEAFD